MGKGERVTLIRALTNIFFKKQFDQKEIDAALDKARSDERLHGGDLTEVKNEDLFVIDTGKGKKKEPVKSKLIPTFIFVYFKR